MDAAFAGELECLARELLTESKRDWGEGGARPEMHAYAPEVDVTGVTITTSDGVGTIHVTFVDARYPAERFGAHFKVPPYMEGEGERDAVLAMTAGHVLTAFGEVTWAGGPPLLRPAAKDGVRWFTGDVI